MKYFSSTYSDARDKFLKAADEAGARIENIQHPLKGPNGEPLFTDVAELGPPDAQDVIVLSSATHGVEGFTGSGIQTWFLHDEIASHIDSNLGFLFIHAINPYGFAHLRRVNEDNIDLNYNFSDHLEPYPKNTGYDKLADTLAPESISISSEVVSWSRLISFRIAKGKKNLDKAITGGQYTHPQGLFYGGTFATWSNRTIHEIAHRYLSLKKRVVIIDFHTGLGKYGSAEIMLDLKRETNRHKRAIKIWGNEYVPERPVGILLNRSLKLEFPKMLPNSEVTAISLEYGTLPSIKVLQALRLENWLHHHGGKDHPDLNRIKARLLSAFYPQQDDWKHSVLKIGIDVIEKAIGYLRRPG